MLKRLCRIKFIATILSLVTVLSAHAWGVACGGEFPDPFSDVCWKCLFPIHLGPGSLMNGQKDNGDPKPPLLCVCPIEIPPFIKAGTGVQFWEPARIVEVVRTPMCSPTLGGKVIASLPVPAGTHHRSDDTSGSAFYHVHEFYYPLLSWLGLLITQGACGNNETFDVFYLSELDVTQSWAEDSIAFIISPEAVLFTSPIAQAACAADSVKAAATHFGIDALFWCSGSQGSLYPLSGTHAHPIGGVDTSLAITHKQFFKMHRIFLSQDTSTLAALCNTIPQPIMRKKQYKAQMLYPKPYTRAAFGFGTPSSFWASGREFPYEGEDFSYLIWRKRTCCAL